MLPDEEEIRRGLSRREVRPGRDAWPEIRSRLESRTPGTGRARLTLAAVALVLLAAALWRRPTPSSISTSRVAPGFQVSRVESRGQPSAAMVLRPDQNTMMVIVPD